MGVKIIVDGYNLLFRMGSFQGSNLEESRNSLLDMLSAYAKARRQSLIVVLDGQQVGDDRVSYRKGVTAIYTVPPETADDRIVKLSFSMREKALVVTSDGGLASRILPSRCGHVTVEEFLPKLEEAYYMSVKGCGMEEDEGKEKDKKGPSRKPSKKARRKKRYLDKL